MTKISVIIPTYGKPVFLKQSIESVVNQTFKDWELIIVDDNNPETDERRNTEVIVESFLKRDSRIQYIKHERNKNGAAARNTGFAVAVGEYISLLDSDDEYLPTRLQKCFNIMDSAPKNFAGVYTGCEYRKGGKTFSIVKDVKSGNFLTETLACTFQFCTGSNIFVRKRVVDELQGFDETFLRHQDYEFLVRLFEKYSLEAIPEVLVIKNNENFNVPNLRKMEKVKVQYLEKFKNLIDSLPIKDQKRIFYSQYIGLAESAMRSGKYKDAIPFYKKADEYFTIHWKEWIRMLAFPIYNLIH